MGAVELKVSLEVSLESTLRPLLQAIRPSTTAVSVLPLCELFIREQPGSDASWAWPRATRSSL